MTRIIAGSAKGRTLSVPPRGTRPTSDRVREAVFSMVDARRDLEGLFVLDLYAGSGALGLEALSRGATHATLVDSDRAAVATIARNASALALPGARTQRSGVRDFLAQRSGVRDFLAQRSGVQRSGVRDYPSLGPDGSGPGGLRSGGEPGSAPRFDVVFVDPPYALDTDEVEADLVALVTGGWLADDAFVILERASRSDAPRWPNGFDVAVDKVYGDTRVILAHWSGSAAPAEEVADPQSL
ncbi:RsmD family RNA methyltransferase [Gordonia jinhuaensis]|uniref:Methyltransferase n=1 Tax=Gordonia jinhuaensis TaxID=1517702 RepID=A0A916T6A7_9ACTN|nr:RsmD family RNA methyltransferase [Gordonia jinhuaensis]GGB30466.1 methyltransferase [Gordonia jinhuaensis]